MQGKGTGRRLRVGIELSAIRDRETGVEVYLRNLVRHLALDESSHRYFLFVNVQDVRSLRKALPAGVRVIPTSARWRPTRTFGHQVIVPILARLLRLNVLHSASFVTAFLCRSTFQVLTVHDMTFFTLPESIGPQVDKMFRRAVLKSLQRADRVVVPSLATQNAIRKVSPDVDEGKIRVIPLGVGSEFREITATDVAAVCARLGLPKRYILFVGTLEPRKNLVRLLSAYRHLLAEDDTIPDLVLAGQMGWKAGSLHEALDHPASAGRIHVTGYVSGDDLPALYSGAELSIYPSLEEGFGLPPLESMACGTPVVSSNVSSTGEILEGAAILVDPLDEQAIAQGVWRLLSDRELRARLKEQGQLRAKMLSWEDVARRTIDVYEEWDDTDAC